MARSTGLHSSVSSWSRWVNRSGHPSRSKWHHTYGYDNISNYFFWCMADYFCRYLIGDWQDTVDIPQLKE